MSDFEALCDKLAEAINLIADRLESIEASIAELVEMAGEGDSEIYHLVCEDAT